MDTRRGCRSGLLARLLESRGPFRRVALETIRGAILCIAFAALGAPTAVGSPAYYVPVCYPYGIGRPAHPNQGPDRARPDWRVTRAGSAGPFQRLTNPPWRSPRSAAGAGNESWSPLSAMGWLSAAMIVDSPRDRLVLAGGWNDAGASGDTWVRSLADSGRWRQLDLDGPAPYSLVESASIYDPVRERMVVFGGRGANAVWALSLSGTPAWTMLAPPGSGPSDRWGACAIYDPVGDRLLAFGGYSPDQYTSWYHDDVWAFGLADDSGWTLLSPKGGPPGPRAWGASAYDPVRRRMLVLSGADNEGRLPSDLWALTLGDSLAWTELHAAGDGPPGLWLTASTYDSLHDRMLVYGGNAWDGWQNQTQAEAWVLELGDSLRWTRAAGAQPGARAGACVGYDTRRDRFAMFGGSGDDTWALSLTQTPAWTLLEPGGPSPPSARYLMSAVYDSARARTLTMDGTNQYEAEDEYLAYSPPQLWSLARDARTRWTLMSPDSEPVGHFGRSLVIDPIADRLIAYGGFSYNDWTWGGLWQLPLQDGSPWSALAAAGGTPAARYLHAAVYDPRGRRMIVFGGRNWDRAYGDTWMLLLDGEERWTRLDSLAPAPRARFGHGAIYDPVGNRMVVFGGGTDSVCFNDTWQLALDGTPAWSLLDAGAGPSARAFAATVYDSRRQRLVLFGGRAADGAPMNDLWYLPLAPGSHWTRADSSGDWPLQRWGAAAAYDAGRDLVVIAYGVQDPCNNSWALQTADAWGLRSADPVPAALAAGQVKAHPWSVTLAWRGVPTANFAGAVQRRTKASGWIDLGPVSQDATGQVVYEDRTAQPGTRYGYRLVWSAGPAAATSAESWVDVPRLSFALAGATPNPSHQGLAVAFSLPDAAAARLSVYDVSGRRLLRRDVGTMGPGDHVVQLDATGTFRPGVYLIQLERGGKSLATRASVIR